MDEQDKADIIAVLEARILSLSAEVSELRLQLATIQVAIHDKADASSVALLRGRLDDLAVTLFAEQ